MFFIVRKMAQVKKRPGGYELLTEKGGRLGELEGGVRNPLTRFFQSVGLGVQWPRRIQVIDTQGKTMLSLHKAIGYGRMSAAVRASDGVVVGRVRQVAREMGMSGERFEVRDRANKLLGYIVGDWRAWNLQMFDDSNGLLGKITKKGENVNRVIYADVDHFSVALSRPIPGDLRRRLILSVAASLELLMT